MAISPAKPSAAQLRQAKTDLATIPRPAKGAEIRARALVRTHAKVIDAVLAEYALPTFQGTTAAEAWAYFGALDEAAQGLQTQLMQKLGLELTLMGHAPQVPATLAVRRRNDRLPLAAWGCTPLGACDRHFATRNPVPSLTRAAALLAVPHDVKAAVPSLLCHPRPWRGAPEAKLVDYLLWKRDEGSGAAAATAELDALIAARIATTRLAVLRPDAPPAQFWRSLDAALQKVSILLSVCFRGRTLEIGPVVRLVPTDPEQVDENFNGPATVQAIFHLLDQAGVSTERLAALATRDEALLLGALGDKLEVVIAFETEVRSKPARGSLRVKLPPKPKSRDA